MANLAIVPMQDVLRLDGTHRMNMPGAGTGQWAWRFDWGGIGPAPAHALARLAGATGRGAFAAVTAL